MTEGICKPCPGDPKGTGFCEFHECENDCQSVQAAKDKLERAEEHNAGLARVLDCDSQHHRVAAAVILLKHRAEEAEAKLAAVLNPPKGFREWLDGIIVSADTAWTGNMTVKEVNALLEKTWTAALSSVSKPIAEEELERLWTEINTGGELSDESIDTISDLLSRLREVQSQGNTEKGGKK